MRNTGRTSIMLHRAVASALEGKRVMVVAATWDQAKQMYRRVAEMQTPKAAHKVNLALDYGDTGRLIFVADTRSREHERGWMGDIVVDHYAYENAWR
jgi:hypothetical protein